MKIKMPEMPPATLLAALGFYNLLPAIVFLPTRRRCDQAATEAAFTRRDPNAERFEARREFMRGLSLPSIPRCVGIAIGTPSFAAASPRIMPATFPPGNW